MNTKIKHEIIALCGSLKDLDKRYRRLYHMSMIENIEDIREQEIHQSMEEQKQTENYVTCGGSISFNNGFCF